MRCVLPDSLYELEARFGTWRHVINVKESLCGELTVPAASGAARNKESDIFWKCLEEESLDQIPQVYARGGVFCAGEKIFFRVFGQAQLLVARVTMQ